MGMTDFGKYQKRGYGDSIKKNISSIKRQLDALDRKFHFLNENRVDLTSDVLIKAKRYTAVESRVRKIKPIIEKRKHAFTVYEWMAIREILKIADC